MLTAPAAGQQLLFKTDAVVEGVHFTAETPGEKVGRKALARAVSDMAAMAGTPTSAVITLGLPAGFSPERVEAMYRGMAQFASQATSWPRIVTSQGWPLATCSPPSQPAPMGWSWPPIIIRGPVLPRFS